MKLAISNIAWDTGRIDEFLALCADLGCDLEFSPSMVWKEPVEASATEVAAFACKVRGYGIKIISMHSLTYPRPDLTFFDSPETRRKLVDYIVGLGRLCRDLSIPHMVFGSAKARMIGARDRNMCFNVMADAFRSMAEQCAPLGVAVLIEPLSSNETDSVVGCAEGMDLIHACGHPNFNLHVDLKSTFAQQEDQNYIWGTFGRFIRHCHVADPGLEPPSNMCSGHVAASAAMKKYNYTGYVSIEMKRCNDPAVVETAVKFVKDVYGA